MRRAAQAVKQKRQPDHWSHAYPAEELEHYEGNNPSAFLRLSVDKPAKE